jgi:hypothetical protein
MELEVLRYTNRISSEAHREVSWVAAVVGWAVLLCVELENPVEMCHRGERESHVRGGKFPMEDSSLPCWAQSKDRRASAATHPKTPTFMSRWALTPRNFPKRGVQVPFLPSWPLSACFK